MHNPEPSGITEPENITLDIETLRPIPRFTAERTASGTRMIFSEAMREYDLEVAYAARRAQNPPTTGAQGAQGLLHLGNAFRFIEKLYLEGAIDFKTRRSAGNLLCDRFEQVTKELTMWDFSRGNPENAGCE
jgi:hypothetical protein